jgi:EAL domain-containing protein (putative c-di-GMP-specific phosphodiesterase class I)/ActR/RegA family two-component response regulator
MRILVVDDDPFALKLLSRQLEQLGADDVQTCRAAPPALQLLDEQPAGFDVLFVDLNMPGMDGVEFLRHLARRRYRGGLALVSGEDDRLLQSVAKLAQAHRLRVLGTLHKPVSPAQLERLLDAAPLQGRPSVIGSVRKEYGAEELREAIAAGQVGAHYQPQVELASGDLVGAEALARWQHPADGLVLPDQFIAVAEDNGLSAELAHTVLAAALRDVRRWRDAGVPLRLSVNVSMDALQALEFPEQVLAAAATAGIQVSNLVLEVTESQLMRDRLLLLDIGARLRLKRIGLSIDDFGTGFSSLAQLRDIPFDEMKLDRGFVHGAADNASLRAILEANLGMARQLGIRTVAEGVEHRGDWDLLHALGCDLAQGYFIARPMPGAELPAWARRWRQRRHELLRAAP